MKQFLLSVAVFFATASFAQKGLDGMIAAEKSFAASAITNGIKQAFLQFVDTGAIMFEKGQPVNGYQLWMSKKNSPGILAWRPRFAEIAASGDFGYTCGPWTFQAQTIADSVVASGFFFTLWQMKDGVWKFILDVGTDEGPQLVDTDVLKVETVKNKGTTRELLNTEKDFIEKYNKDPLDAYEKFLSKKSVLNRNAWPLTTLAPDQQKLIFGLPKKIRFEVQGSGIAPSGDLGYVYGSIAFKEKKENYLHIWRKESGGWKLALEMMRL